MATIVRSISADAAQQPHRDLLARVMPLELRGHDEEAVGTHERGEHARSARERGGHELATHAP